MASLPEMVCKPAARLWGGGGRQSPEASPGRWETAALQVLLSLQGVGISCLNLHIYFWFRSFASVRRGVQLSRFPERL